MGTGVPSGTSVSPFSAANLSRKACLSSGSPASGPYCDRAGSAVASATACSAAAGGAQCTMPAFRRPLAHHHY